MFKLVVLFAIVAVAASSAVYPWAYSAGLPSASGYEYSSSIHAPDYITHQSVHSPLALDSHVVSYAAPAVYAAPAAVSHQNHVQVHSKPALVASVYAPAVHAYGEPLVHGW